MYFEGLVAASLIAGGLHALAIGANDGANVLGVTVGSGSLTEDTALRFVILFELIGAVTVGREVTSGAQGSIFDIAIFEGDEKWLIIGLFSTLIGSAIIVLAFSYWRLPISTTQVTTSGILVIALITEGETGAVSEQMDLIAVSWVLSPIAGALISYSLSRLIIFFMLQPGESEQRARIFMPFMFGLACFILPLYVAIRVDSGWVDENAIFVYPSISVFAVFIYLLTRYIAYDWLAEIAFRISPLVGNSNGIISSHILKYGSSEDLLRKVDRLGAERVFCILQLIAVAFFSFSHGANDVANTASPIALVLHVAKTGVARDDYGDVDFWVPILYGFLICIGILLFSSSVTRTVAGSITSLAPSGGFVILVSSAIALSINNYIEYPTSTTQVIIGSIAGMGMAKASTERVKWRSLRIIFAGWVMCVVASMVLVPAIYCMIVGMDTLLAQL